MKGEETKLESNLLSQLVSIEKSDQTRLTFSYDPLGRLLVEKSQDLKDKKSLSTLRYFYLGFQEIGTLSSKGTVDSLKVPGLEGDRIASTSIAFEIKGETYAPLHDIAGNVTKLIDPLSRDIIESYQYTAFGEEAIYDEKGQKESHSKVGNPWRFAEKRIDERSGLILFGLRFYDPSLGRWISQDPAGSFDGPNLYSYLHNNPINQTDRFGLATEANTRSAFEQYFYGEVETHCYCEKHRDCKRGGDIGKAAGPNLPKITYNDHFEEFYKDYRSREFTIPNFYDDSATYDLSSEGLLNLPDDLEIGFINGVWNDFDGAKESARYLSKLTGGYNIHGVYNATHGKSVDILECNIGLKYIATEPVRQLHKMWNSFFDRSSAKAKFLMICHSQGAIHVRNALLDYPPELRERILVVAIAPGGYIYQETCAQVIHYRTELCRDFISHLDRSGAEREKKTIVTLQSHPCADLFDHEFMSRTYKLTLQRHIMNYIKNLGQEL